MDRKKFLKTSALAAFSLSAFGKVLASGDHFEGDCATTNDILGPFYRPDAPVRQDLIHTGLEGVRITLKGQVFGADCSTPLEKSVVEIWHANKVGEYDTKSPRFQQRARWLTPEDGSYSFRTILPGKYLNGGQYRPAHIHFRVRAKGHQELISQVYFSGDPHITDDPWASQPKAERRILPLVPEDIEGNLVLKFDIYLAEK